MRQEHIFYKQQEQIITKKNYVVPTCKLCGDTDETITHFLLTCKELEDFRTTTVKKIIHKCSIIFSECKIKCDLDLLQIIVDPFYYCNYSLKKDIENKISLEIEPLCRQLIYKLHSKRYQMLQEIENSRSSKKKIA